MLSTLRALISALVVIGLSSGCRGPGGGWKEAFVSYLHNAEVVPYAKLGTVLAREPVGKTSPQVRCLVSASGRYLATVVVNTEDPAKSRLTVAALDCETTVAGIEPIRSKDLVIVPEDAKWGPSDCQLFVFMKYSDIERGAGGEWLRFDLRTGDFSPEARKKLAYLLSFTKDTRPDGLYSARAVHLPVWDYRGTRYDSGRDATLAGVTKWWEPPAFAGEAGTCLCIKNRWYEVLIEQGIGRSKQTGDAYVFCQGVLVQRMELATKHTPDGALLFYEHNDLVMVGGADDELNQYRPWNVRFAQSKLDRMFVIKFGGEQKVVLVARSPEFYTVYLLRTNDRRLFGPPRGAPER